MHDRDIRLPHVRRRHARQHGNVVHIEVQTDLRRIARQHRHFHPHARLACWIPRVDFVRQKTPVRIRKTQVCAVRRAERIVETEYRRREAHEHREAGEHRGARVPLERERARALERREVERRTDRKIQHAVDLRRRLLAAVGRREGKRIVVGRRRFRTRERARKLGRPADRAERHGRTFERGRRAPAQRHGDLRRTRRQRRVDLHARRRTHRARNGHANRAGRDVFDRHALRKHGIVQRIVFGLDPVRGCKAVVDAHFVHVALHVAAVCRLRIRTERPVVDARVRNRLRRRVGIDVGGIVDAEHVVLSIK